MWLFVLIAAGVFALAYLIGRSRILVWVGSANPEALLFAALAVWAGTALAMYGWRRISLRRASGAARRAEKDLVARLQQDLDLAAEQSLDLAAVTTEWAVRAEMVRDDVEDIQEYMQRLVKRPHIRRALVASSDGTVIASGDRAERGESLARLVPELPVESAGIQKVAGAGEGRLVVVPVMGLESRLGTLVLEIEQAVLRVEETRTAP